MHHKLVDYNRTRKNILFENSNHYTNTVLNTNYVSLLQATDKPQQCDHQFNVKHFKHQTSLVL